MKSALKGLLVFALLFFVLASGTALYTYYFVAGKAPAGKKTVKPIETPAAEQSPPPEQPVTPPAPQQTTTQKQRTPVKPTPAKPKPPPAKKPQPTKRNIGKVRATGHITQENTKSVLPIKGAVGIWRKSEKRLDIGVLPFTLTAEDMDLLRNNHGQLHGLVNDKPPPEGSDLKHCPWGFVRLMFSPDKPLLLANASECQVASYGLPFKNTGFYFDRDLGQRSSEFTQFKVTVDDTGGEVTLKAKGKATENDGRRDWDFNWEMDLHAEVLVYP